MKAHLKITAIAFMFIAVSCNNKAKDVDTYKYSDTEITHEIIERGTYDRFESYHYTLTNGLITEFEGLGGYLANKKDAPDGVYIIGHLFFQYEDQHLVRIYTDDYSIIDPENDSEYKTVYALTWEDENLVRVEFQDSYFPRKSKYVITYSSALSSYPYELTRTNLAKGLVPIDLTLAKKGYFGIWSKNQVEKIDTQIEEEL